MNKPGHSFARNFVLPAALVYGLALIATGSFVLWHAAKASAPIWLGTLCLFVGFSVWHHVLTSKGHLGTAVFKPSAALDEWSLLGTDEQNIRHVRILTRITGGITAAWCMLVVAMTLLDMWDIYPLFQKATALNLNFVQIILLSVLHLVLSGLTFAYVLMAWRTQYLA